MLTKQVVLVQGERITEVGSEGLVTIPSGAQVIDLERRHRAAGLIDAHTHMFNNPTPKMSRERSTIIAIQNLQSDLRAGFTAARDMSSHGNGYADVDLRDAINRGDIDGPRFQVSGRGIRWSAEPPNPKAPDNPLADTVIRSLEEGRAAVRDAAAHGVDWIKLYPGGAYSFGPNGEAQYVTTYPLPVLQGLIEEAHKLGKKVACHVFGGDGLQYSITAGCDTVEHGYALTQAQLDEMVRKKLDFDPTLARYNAPFMDDNDAKNTGGKYRMVPIFERAVSLAVKTKGLRTMVGSGVDGSTFPHGTQANEFEQLVKKTGMTTTQALAGRHDRQRQGVGLGWSDRLDHQRQVRRHRRRAGRSGRRHHAAPQGDVRDEGREGHSTGLGATCSQNVERRLSSLRGKERTRPRSKRGEQIRRCYRPDDRAAVAEERDDLVEMLDLQAVVQRVTEPVRSVEE